ncbi:MAG: aldo/keto reductase [Pseudomonadota bacterium]
MTHAPTVDANGAHIPAIGLGTWPMKDDECRVAVATALDLGYRHIDTAAMYGNEDAVGDGVRASSVDRDDVFVTTKVWPDNIRDGDLQRSAEASLERLGLDTVDLLLIHWPNREVSVRECIGALCDAKKRGLTRHIGISNFTTTLIDEALAVTSEPLVCNQVEYQPNLNQDALLARCRQNGLAVVSYCPLGRGDVGGTMDEAVVKDIAATHGKTPGQIVLRWHVQQPGVVAVPKSANPERIAQNLAVFDFALTEDEMAQLSALARPDGRVVTNIAFAPDWD